MIGNMTNACSDDEYEKDNCVKLGVDKKYWGYWYLCCSDKKCKFKVKLKNM